MAKILKVRTPSDFSSYHGLTDRHPLVSVIDFAEISPVRHTLNHYGVYGMFMHTNLSVDLTYGCGKYDYKSGTLICVAPGQVGGKEDNGELIDLDGWALLFHPDLLRGTPLETTIKECTFFDYHVNEALHLTDDERDLFESLMRQIKSELEKPRDAFQDRIIVEYIGLLLNFCMRFYNRQFLTRKLENTNLLAKFDNLLRKYFDEKKQLTIGLPTVQYFADKLCMSSNYFGDLVKKMTGETASSHIRQFVVQQIKDKLASGANVTEVAYALGFEYPQHLSRMFKTQTGQSPKEYIEKLRNK